MQRIVNAIPFVVVGAVLLIALGQFQDSQRGFGESRVAHVKTVCDMARAAIVTSEMQKCYAAQLETNTEYLCDLNNQCWVEVK